MLSLQQIFQSIPHYDLFHEKVNLITPQCPEEIEMILRFTGEPQNVMTASHHQLLAVPYDLPFLLGSFFITQKIIYVYV